MNQINDLTYWFDFSMRMVLNHPLMSVATVLVLQMQPQAVARIKGLPGFRVGWQWRIRKRDLVKWMANHKLQRPVTP